MRCENRIECPILREDSPALVRRLLAGGLLGLLLGVVFVFGRRRFAATFQTVTDVQRKLDSIPNFSIVPKRPKRRKRNKASLELEPPLFDH